MDRAPETAWVRTDQELVTLFHLACLNHGVLFAPRGFFALSTVMTEAIVDGALERCAAAMSDIAGAA